MFGDEIFGSLDRETNLERLEIMQTYVNQKDEEGRRDFFSQLVKLLNFWWSDYPDLRAIFQSEEIEALLLDSMNDKYASIDDGKIIIEFVAESGYKNVPKLDRDGDPISNRPTPIHLCTARYSYSHERKAVLDQLFNIYDNFHVNYSDHSGYTHFHVACETGRVDDVQKFLKIDQDLSNLVVKSTGDSPLHLALKNWERGNKKVFVLLLKNGADPNWANAEKLTPLHLISQRHEDDNTLQMLMRHSDQKHWPIRVDPRDKLGRTPLEWAVENILPLTVHTLLKHGGLKFKFVFPTESDFGKNLKPKPKYDKFELAFRLPIVINRLVEFGYVFHPSDTQTVTKFLNRHNMFHVPKGHEARRFGDEEFVRTSTKIRIRRNFSLHDLIELKPEVAQKRINYKDYLAIRKSENFWPLHAKDYCAVLLFDKLASGFLQQWDAADSQRRDDHQQADDETAACQNDEDSEKKVKSTTKRKSVRTKKSSKLQKS